MKNLRPLKLRKSRKIIRKFLPFLIIAGLFMLIVFILSTFSGSNPVVTQILSGTGLKSTNGRINVLLLGIAGGAHAGANLTDTIMIASYDLKSNKVYLISIPRDLWLPSLQSKANAAYQTGLLQENGLGLVKTIMGNIVGLPVSYALRIDFRGFEEAVDILGGLDITVDQTFDDYNYPVAGKENDLCGYEEKEMDFSEEQAKELNIEPGKRKVFIAPDGKIATDSAGEDTGTKYFTCRYEHLRFEKGLNHMGGITALKFVRSRHGTNGEASDFARSKRQEKVIGAIRDKIISFDTLSSPGRISQLLETFGKSIDTDISVKDAIEFYKLSRKVDKVHSFVLDDSIFTHPSPGSYGGVYVLVSMDDDFSIVQGYVRKILRGEVTEYEATASARPRN